ncbi:MAG TPA: ABC transporter permease [Acidimicrobiia bacterium]|nr:ABC transporter permease [Acidimicrobiia bacterium]
MTTDTATPAADERVRQVSIVTRLLTRPELGAIVGTVVVWVFFAIVASDNNFVSWGTTAAILNRAAPLGLMAIAVSLLMIGGEFDLSIGSLLGWSGMVIMLLVTPASAGGFGWALWPAVTAALLIALLSGFLNGLLVMWTKLPSFIITLGSLFIFRGLAVAIPRIRTNRTQLGGLDEVAGFELADRLFGTDINIFGAQFDIAILWWVGLTLVATFVLLRTRFGNWIFGAGGDANSARNTGVPVTRVKILLFMTTATAAFLVAFIQAVQFNGSDSLRGTLQEFNAIIAVVVGGTLLTGGYGSVIGAMFGALIFAMVQQGIIVTGVDGDWFRVFVGGVLVLAVIFNNFIRTQAARR